MKKISNILQGILVSCIILVATTNKVNSFGLFPPLPFEPGIDVPAGAAKTVSNIKAVADQVQTVKNGIESFSLKNLQGILTSSLGLARSLAAFDSKGNKKVPGKGKFESFNSEFVDVSISDAQLTDEESFYKLYYKLFFVYPDFKNNKYPEDMIKQEQGQQGYQILQTAHKNKRLEYQQDIIVDTYVYSQNMETYLNYVERTLQRLQTCINDPTGASNEAGVRPDCKFFGLEMMKIPEPSKSTEDIKEDEENPGLMALAYNQYIVTTVYDRLMRIVEDMVAMEAIYQASRQIDASEPIDKEMIDGQTSYNIMPQKYQFTYNNKKNTTHAVLFNIRDAKIVEDTSDDLTSNYKNKLGNTAILSELQRIESIVADARDIHNKKTRLADYKTQYRKYLKAKEVHERILKALKTADSCAETFVNSHRGKKPGAIWGKTAEANDYEARVKNTTSISGWLINAYQNATKDMITGEGKDCPGYYQIVNGSGCPDGYTPDMSNQCKVKDPNSESDDDLKVVEGYYGCVLENDVNAYDDNRDTDSKYTDENDEDMASVQTSYDEYTDNAEDDDEFIYNEDIIETENHIKSEINWRIGYNKLMELTENEQLKFNPWKDQKKFQFEYMRNKYRNINIIVGSVDVGIEAYKLALIHTTRTEEIPEMADIIAAVNSVDTKQSWEASKEEGKAKANEECLQKIPADYNYSRTSSATATDGIYKATCSGRKKYYYNCGSRYGCSTGYYTTSATAELHQFAGNDAIINGAFAQFTYQEEEEPVESRALNYCDGLSWPESNYSIGYLVRSYLKEHLGECRRDVKYQDILRNYMHKNGRRVAQSFQALTMEERKNYNSRVNTMVTNYNYKLDKLNKELIRLKKQRDDISKQISDETKKLNVVKQEYKRSLNRIKANKEDIENIKKREEKNNEIVNRSIGRDDKEGKCGLDIQIDELNFEIESIKGNNPTRNIPSTCNEYKDKDYVMAHLKKDKQYNIALSAKYKDLIHGILNEDEDAEKYVTITEASGEISKLRSSIDYKKTLLKNITEKIAKKEDEIKRISEEYAVAYLKLMNDMQEAVTEINDQYEQFKESDDDENSADNNDNHVYQCRMTKAGRYCKNAAPSMFLVKEIKEDTLEESFNQGFHGGDRITVNNIRDVIMDKYIKRDEIFPGMSPDFFADDGTISLAHGAIAKSNTANNVRDKVRKIAATLAAEIIFKEIKNDDAMVMNAVNSALKEVNKLRREIKVLPTVPLNEEQTLKDMAKPKNYDEGINYRAKHNALINTLRKIQERYSADGDMFHIPSNSNISAEDKNISDEDRIKDENYYKYFVGLPARGNQYLKKYVDAVPYNKNVREWEQDTGEDYKEPTKPMLNLPPLREVFYFDPIDYDVTPKNDAGGPVISYMLDYKYSARKYEQSDYSMIKENIANVQKWENMPKVWRYMLARPNLRDTSNSIPEYAYTFYERPYIQEQMIEYLYQDDPVDTRRKRFREILSKGDVYPCNVSGQGSIRLFASGDSAGNLSFIKAPGGAGTCQEIETYSKRPCITYGNKGSGICHLMADHGQDKKDNQEELSFKNDIADTKESEIGLFMEVTNNPRNLDFKYRTLYKNVMEELLKSNEDDPNNIDRKKQETIVFKRNIFGSFIDMVKAEKNAHDNLIKIEADLDKSLGILCDEIHSITIRDKDGKIVTTKDENGKTINETLKLSGETDANPCQKILKDNGLASTSEDYCYGITGEYNDSKYICGLSTYYATIYNMYESEKNSRLEMAKTKLSGINASDYQDNAGQERYDQVMAMIEALDKDGDPLEAAYITPSMDGSKAHEAQQTAITDRTLSLQKDDESIETMENQGQIVPYCPTYINESVED